MFDTTITHDTVTYDSDIVTRTAFTDKFELICRLGYSHNDTANNGLFKIGVKGLFKFNDHNSIAVGLDKFEGDQFITNVGYRYSF